MICLPQDVALWIEKLRFNVLKKPVKHTVNYIEKIISEQMILRNGKGHRSMMCAQLVLVRAVQEPKIRLVWINLSHF